MSAERDRLIALRERSILAPAESRPGDLWVDRRLGIVMIALGVKRARGIKHTGQNFTFLYHWGKPSLTYRGGDWDEFASNSTCDSFRRVHGEKWEYYGNIFDKLPYESFGGPWRGPNAE